MSHPVVQTVSALLPRLFRKTEETLRPAFLLAVRLCWGFQFAQTGWGKLTHIDGVTQFFTSLGIPFPMLNAVVAGGTEFVGGLLLMVGLGSRLASAPLAFTMCVAFMTSDLEALQGISLTNWDSLLEAAPFLFLFASVIVLIFGPGPLSLDHLIRRRFSPAGANPSV
jgi:putative oxidoreductase